MTPVQFITHRTARYGYVEGAQMALEGGCRWIQLRMKEATDEEVKSAAEVLLPRCRACGAETYYLRAGKIIRLLEHGYKRRVHCARCGSNDLALYERD